MVGGGVFSDDEENGYPAGSGRVATNMRACLIIEAIAEHPDGLTPTEVSRTLNLPKQTVHRVCRSLVEQEFLARDPARRVLTPGARLRRLATGVLQSSQLHILRHQILARVAHETGETVNYVMPQADGMSYIDRVETDWAFRVQLPIGSNVPFHCTASGKVWLASLSEAERRRVIGKLDLGRYTDATICKPDALVAEVDEVARSGYSIDNQEFMDGMFAVSVPVLDSQGRYTASLAVHGPTVRLDISKKDSVKDVLLQASSDLTDALFVSD